MKAILEDILLPVDLSGASLNALNTAVHMAGRHQARLHLLYVSDLMFYYPQVGELTAMQTMADDVLQKDGYVFEKLAGTIRAEHGVDCRFYSRSGNRSLAIRQWVQQHPVDLIILGMSVQTAGSSYLFDSLAYQLLQGTACHVLSVPAGKAIDGFQHIIYPVQSTGVPMCKVALAGQIAEKNQADVSVVSLVASSDADSSQTLRKLSARIRFRLSGRARSVSTGQVYTRNAAASLAAICQKELGDLVVIEGSTRRNLKEFFFGNFTQQMLRNGQAAVLCINPLQDSAPGHERQVRRPRYRGMTVAY